MPSYKVFKKQTKQLVSEYYDIVLPNVKTKRVIISKNLIPFDQRFEIFSLYSTDEWAMTSNTTPYIETINTELENA